MNSISTIHKIIDSINVIINVIKFMSLADVLKKTVLMVTTQMIVIVTVVVIIIILIVRVIVIVIVVSFGMFTKGGSVKGALAIMI